MNRKLGLKAGAGWHLLSFESLFSSQSSAGDEAWLTEIDAKLASLGLQGVYTRFVDLSSPSGRSYRFYAKRSWFVDVLYAASTVHEFMDESFYQSVPDFDHNMELIKIGGRVGFEWASLLSRKSGIGLFYRVEAGYRPGYRVGTTAYGAGGFLKFEAGVNLGKRFDN